MKLKTAYTSILLLLGFMAGFGQTIPFQSVGNSGNEFRIMGIGSANKGFMLRNSYTDTTEMNTDQWLKLQRGVQARSGDTIWQRSHDLTRWFRTGAGSIIADTSNSVILFGDGSLGSPLTAEVIASPQQGNALQSNGDGLFVKNIIQDGITEPGVITWISGYNYDVSPAVGVIGGVEYTSAWTPITLAASHATLNRIDLVVFNAGVGSSVGTITVITGTPAADPQQPTLTDPSTQLAMAFILVTANTTAPPSPPAQDWIYINNAEWTTLSSTARINAASTNNPYSVPLDVQGIAATNGDNIRFTSVSPPTIANFSVLTLKIRAASTWVASERIGLRWYSGGTPIGSEVSIANGAYGFTSSNLSSYQIFSVPLSDFGALSSVTALLMTVRGRSVSFYIDDIQLQAGTVPAVGYTASNGITLVGSDFQLGGVVTNNNTISFDNGKKTLLFRTTPNTDFGDFHFNSIDTVNNPDDWNQSSGFGLWSNKTYRYPSYSSQTYRGGNVLQVTYEIKDSARFNSFGGDYGFGAKSRIQFTKMADYSGKSLYIGGIRHEEAIPGHVSILEFSDGTSTTTNYRWARDWWTAYMGHVYLEGRDTLDKYVGFLSNGAIASTSRINYFYDFLAGYQGANHGSARLGKHWGFYNISPLSQNYFGGNVLIGDSNTISSALLNVTSTTKGVIWPRMTTTQKNAIASPATGLIVFDTDLVQHYFWDGDSWEPMGGIVTADNGLTANTSTNVKLGGTLTENTTISGGSFTTSWTSSLASPFGTFSATNSSSGAALVGVSTSGYGVSGSSTSGIGVRAYSVSSFAGQFEVEPSSTNTTAVLLSLRRLTSGAPASNIAASISFSIQNSVGSVPTANTIVSRLTSVTDGAETSQLIITGVNSASTQDIIYFEGNGRTRFNGRAQYQQGADVASIAGAIALGLDGNVFELTGTNAVTLISNLNWQNGSEITFVFTSTATLTDGTANSGTDIGMELAGNVNFVGSAGATLTLVLSEIGGVQRFREKCRSVN